MNKALPYLEKIFLIALLVGLLLSYFEIVNGGLTNISLAGLGVTFFLSAFSPLDVGSTEGEPFGFNELLGLAIVPKVLGTSSAVGIFGILFYSLDFGNNGYIRLLTIGGSTIILCALIFGYLRITETKYFKKSIIGLFKSIPILIAIYYVLFMAN